MLCTCVTLYATHVCMCVIARLLTRGLCVVAAVICRLGTPLLASDNARAQSLNVRETYESQQELQILPYVVINQVVVFLKSTSSPCKMGPT